MRARGRSLWLRPWLWLIRFIGLIVPRRLRSDWRQEWEAELQWREQQLAEWDRLDIKHKLALWWHSAGAFVDALWLQPKRWEDEMMQDLRFAVRMLRKDKSFTLIAVFTLALGIGANTAIFSVADKLLLRSLPVKEPQQLALISGETVNPKFQNNIFSYPDYVDYRDQNEVFSGLLAFNQVSAKLGAGEQADKLNVELVSGNYFDVLGVAAAQGRVIQAEDNRNEDAHPVAVISHSCWQHRLGGKPDVLGQTLQLNGATYTIIGIAPAGFTGMRLEGTAEVWAPLMMRRQLLGATTSNFERKGAWLRLLGRLKPSVTLTAAQAGFDLTARRVWLANTTESERKLPFNEKRILLEAGGQGISSLRRQLGETLKLLLAVVALLLVLACANVANLLLARAASRRKEIAVRLALGAHRWRIVRQLLSESLLLALLGASVGLLFAPWLYQLLFAFQPGFELDRSALGGSLDGRVLGFTALIAIVSGVLFGLVPAWQSARADLTPALKDADASAARHERRWNVRNALVVVQVALALVLLVGAGLLVRSLQRRFAIDPGFRSENLLIVPLELPRTAYAAATDEAGKRVVDERNTQYFMQVAERVKSLPGVASATIATITPFSNSIAKTSVVIEGWQQKPGENLAFDYTGVGPGYHELLGIPLVAGRGFTERDNANAPGVVIVNETLARTYFPNQNPLGKRLSLGVRGQAWLEIIGVTRDHRLHELTEASFPHLDLPLLQRPSGTFARVVVRTKLEPLAVWPAVRKAALALNAQVAIIAPTTLNDEVKDSIAAARMASTLTSLFGLTALLLAGIGLYGVMSYTVSRRTREIGIRMDLGAERKNVLSLVIQQGLQLTALGIALGLLAAVSLTRLVQAMLYQVGTTDPLTFGFVALLLAGVALLACYVPARRATQIDPLRALRHE
ncbi:MAG: ABC transporter permease [Acidobacteria bacterium]|nr:ABC transporter permease [Acidobacteriota bacterium]